jgi:iron(III) transport system permease protein
MRQRNGQQRQSGARAFAVSGLRGMTHLPLPLARWRRPLSVAAWCFALAGALPTASLALRSIFGGGFDQIGRWIGDAAWTSVMSAACAAAIITALGLVAGHALARGAKGAATLDALALLAFVTPAAVLGVALIAVWTSPATRALYTSVAIIVIGYIARYAIVGIRAVAAVIVQGPAHVEEAAAAAGAGFTRRLLRIVVPINLLGIIGAAILAAVFCLRDVETAVLYYPPGRETLPVRIFTLEANGPEPIVAALAIIHVLLTAAVLGVALLLLSGRERPQ